MMRFMITKPDFYLKYKNVRTIINYGHRTQQADIFINGLVVDFETEKPIANAHVYNEDGSSETYTDSTGKFRLPVDKEGTVCVIAEKNGWKRSQEDTDVEKGNEYELNIDMEADGDAVSGDDGGASEPDPSEEPGGSN
jgi:hypothetical protein